MLARNGALDSALDRLRQAAELQPDFAAAHAQIAALALQLDEQSARPSIHRDSAGAQQKRVMRDRAVNDMAEEPSAHAPIITIDAGIESARRAVILQQQQSEYWRTLGAALHRKEVAGEATQVLRRSHELAPADPQPAFLWRGDEEHPYGRLACSGSGEYRGMLTRSSSNCKNDEQ